MSMAQRKRSLQDAAARPELGGDPPAARDARRRPRVRPDPGPALRAVGAGVRRPRARSASWRAPRTWRPDHEPDRRRPGRRSGWPRATSTPTAPARCWSPPTEAGLDADARAAQLRIDVIVAALRSMPTEERRAIVDASAPLRDLSRRCRRSRATGRRAATLSGNAMVAAVPILQMGACPTWARSGLAGAHRPALDPAGHRGRPRGHVAVPPAPEVSEWLTRLPSDADDYPRAVPRSRPREDPDRRARRRRGRRPHVRGRGPVGAGRGQGAGEGHPGRAGLGDRARAHRPGLRDRGRGRAAADLASRTSACGG